MNTESGRIESGLLYFTIIAVISREKEEMIIENGIGEQLLTSDRCLSRFIDKMGLL